MHIHTLYRWQHAHRFSGENPRGERNTWRVIVLTAATMVLEVVAGLTWGSMALLADGWHMGTHVAALSITVLAYAYARRHADDPGYSFGTGKVGVLGGFASAVALAVVALVMAVESIQRLVVGGTIHFDESIWVAVIGLAINLGSAWLLRDTPEHGRSHGQHDHADHDHEAEHGHADHNLRAAYLHVLADATTSLLAIVALLSGKSLGWVWLDPLMGIVGALLITRWAYGLLKDTASILLDRSANPALVAAIRAAIEADRDNRVADLHVWHVSSRELASELSLVTHFPQPAENYRALLEPFDLAHLVVQVYQCEGEPCVLPAGVRP